MRKLNAFLKRAALALLALGLIGFVAYQAWLAYVLGREAAAPSTAQVLVTRDGRRIPLLQPAARPAALGAEPAPAPADPAAPLSPPSPPALPPERLLIPALGVDHPVVLTTVDHLPRFRGVGWLFGSAFPGASGNLVLFGHRGGDFGTFERLPELAPGDTFIVTTGGESYHYQVRQTFETTPDDVAVLAPSEGPTATLITCTGPWDAAAQSNALRLIVVGELIAAPPGGT